MASTSIRKTFSSNGNTKKWTFSAWIKRTGLGSVQRLLSCDEAGNNNHDDFYQFQNDDTIVLGHYDSGYYANLTPTRKFRDCNSWYHFVITWDTAQSTPSDRFKFYVNGVQETSFSTATYPSQNKDSFINTTEPIEIGKRSDNDTQYLDALLTHVHFCDGYAYAASDFGETDATTGEWKAKTSPSVSYGTNGFFIFKDGNSLTDQSSNTNNWSAVSGTLTDLKDNPDNVFCTMNPLDNYWQGSTFSNGNNTVVSGSSSTTFNTSTLMMTSGKWYAEVKPTAGSATSQIGVTGRLAVNATSSLAITTSAVGYLDSGSVWGSNSNQGGTWSTYSNNDIIGIAINLDNTQGGLNKLYFSKNGVWQNSADPSNHSSTTGVLGITAPSNLTGTDNGAYAFAMNETWNDNTRTWQWNFGNGYFGTTAVATNSGNGYAGAEGASKFNYQPPTGFSALSTKGLNE